MLPSLKTRSKVDFDAFQALCDICEKGLDNKTNLKQQKRWSACLVMSSFNVMSCKKIKNKNGSICGAHPGGILAGLVIQILAGRGRLDAWIRLDQQIKCNLDSIV